GRSTPASPRCSPPSSVGRSSPRHRASGCWARAGPSTTAGRFCGGPTGGRRPERLDDARVPHGSVRRGAGRPSPEGGTPVTFPEPRADLRLLTIDAAAYEMGVSRKHVVSLIERGKLKVVLVGCDRRIPVQSILDYYRAEAA